MTDQYDDNDKNGTPVATPQRARNILENTLVYKLTVTKHSFIKKLTKAEREMLLAREQNALAEAKRLQAEAATLIAPKAKKQPVFTADELAEIAEADGDDAFEGNGFARDHNHLRLSKEMIDLTALRPIRALDAQFKVFIASIELKNTLVNGGGRHLIPAPYIKELNVEFDRYKARRAELVEQFIADYPALKREQIEKDPELFKVGEYPSDDEVRAAFDVDYEITSDEVPAVKLRALDDVMLRRELEKSENKWRNVGDEIVESMRQGMSELVLKAADALGSDDGKPRVFRDSMVTQINRFLEFFDGRNRIVGDAKLPAMVADIRAAMNGVTPDALRKNDDTRMTVKAAFDKVKQQMTDENMIVVRRRVLRDDDE